MGSRGPQPDRATYTRLLPVLISGQISVNSSDVNGDGGLKPGFFKAGVASRGFVSCYSSGSAKFSSAWPRTARSVFFSHTGTVSCFIQRPRDSRSAGARGGAAERIPVGVRLYAKGGGWKLHREDCYRVGGPIGGNNITVAPNGPCLAPVARRWLEVFCM